MLVP
jgi:hypothetical protein